MTTFFTRKGDGGYSSLPGVNHISKDDERFEAIGTIDELTSVMGLARSLSRNQETADILITVQHHLYALMAKLASENKDSMDEPSNLDAEVNWLEEKIDNLESVEIPKKFIIPGDTTGGAALDMARTVTRRAERRVVRLAHDRLVSGEIMKYLNRLSSLLFILELYEYQNSGSKGPTLVK